MTNEELDKARVDEAWRVAAREGHGKISMVAARLARENWTPPEPVDPDLVAWRRWALTSGLGYLPSTTAAGTWDQSESAKGFVAGARMAREQERERAGMLLSMAVESTTRFRHLLHSLPLGVRAQLGVKWELDEAFVNGFEGALAKYRGEA
jgi:hypothetical protein